MAPRPSLKHSARALLHAVERRRHPRRFIQTDKTPWEEIHRDGIMAVRHYSLPPMAAINAAIEQATGIRFTELPMSPPRVLKALDEAAASGGDD